jgi:hypothetical protein
VEAFVAHEFFERQEQVLGPSNRSVGLTFAAVLVLIGFAPLLRGGEPHVWSVGAGFAFAAVALIVPRALSPLNRIWTKLGLMLHKVMSPVVLGIMFFVVIMPMGLIMKALRRDPLRLRFDPQADSYWVRREPPGPAPQDLPEQF